MLWHCPRGHLYARLNARRFNDYQLALKLPLKWADERERDS